MRAVIKLAAIAILGLALSSAEALAETVDQARATLGAQAEGADVVARAAYVNENALDGGLREVRFNVVATLKGGVLPGEEIVVSMRDMGHGFPWRKSGEHLVFLSADGDATHRFLSYSGSLGIRPLPDAGSERSFPVYVADHLSHFDAGGKLTDPDGLRTLLVDRMIRAEDPGIVESGARDLVRHRSLHPGLSAEQRKTVLDVFVAHPFGKNSKQALVEAVAAAKPDGAAPAMLDALAHPKARPLRASIATALRTLDDPAITPMVVARLDGAPDTLRAHLIVTLGQLGRRTAVPALQAEIVGRHPVLRAQAAHALGQVARAERDRARAAREVGDDELAARPAEPIAGREQLVALLALARTRNECRAATWALAQLDDERAWDELRRLAEKDERETVRRYAERYLARPRLSLILD